MILRHCGLGISVAVLMSVAVRYRWLRARQEALMEKIEEYRNRLAAFTTAGVGSPDASPAESLKACRSLQSQLRDFKREVLAQLLTLRAKTQEQARRSLDLPSLRELWERRDEGARKLFEDTQERLTGFLDDEAEDAMEAWAEINEEVDARLGRLAELEHKLARAAGEDDAGAFHPRNRPGIGPRDTGDDDLYAAAGAAAQQGTKRGAFCARCGRGIEADDRFCRHCGHSLR